MFTREKTALGVIEAYPRHTFVNNDPENYDPHFSWQKCEMCDGLAGDRYNVAAVIVGSPEPEKVDFEVCQDCVYFVAYGELSVEGKTCL